MQALIIVIHVLAAISIVCLVLLQHGKGADVGASFGSGAANTMLGSAGAIPFLMKVTSGLAAIFFITSLSLAYIASAESKKSSGLMTIPTQPVKKQPAVPQTFVPSNKQSNKTDGKQ